MRVFSKLAIMFVLLLILAASCKSGPKFSDVSGKDWLLIEVKTEPQNISFNRQTLKTEGFENIFTLKFDKDRLAGVGAPNRYTAPYKVDKNQAMSIQMIAGTMMATIHEPEKLKEHDFYTYLQNVNKWNLSNNKLELYTKNADGVAAILIFSN